MIREHDHVSWLALEQFALGEVSTQEATRIEAALFVCPSCRACYDEIRKPVSLRPLVITVTPSPHSKLRPQVVLFAALAAAFLGIILWPLLQHRLVTPPQRDEDIVRAKGEAYALSIVRLRQGVVSRDPSHFLPGDRFKVEVTCPPTKKESYTIVAVQPDEVSIALPAQEISCGNRVPLDGAFSLTGTSPVWICAIQSGAVHLSHLRAHGIRSLPPNTPCHKLEEGIP